MCEHKGAVVEVSGGEGLDKGDNVGVRDLFPSPYDFEKCVFVGEAIPFNLY